MKTIIGLLLLISSYSSFAVSESSFSRDWDQKVLPFYLSMSKGAFQNRQYRAVRFRYSVKPSAKKTIVLLTGRSESGLDFAETLYDLNSPNVNIFVLDHQGQGESERLLKNPQKGHVEHFNDYVDDLDFWITNYVLPKTPKTEMYLLAHSMGAAIGAHYLKRNPGVFKKAVFSSPMFEVNAAPFTESRAYSMTEPLIKAGQGDLYSPGGSDYDSSKDSFASNVGTHSSIRYYHDRNLKRLYPKLIVSSPTMNWVHEAIGATRFIDKEVAPYVRTPILLFQAQLDKTVMTPRQTSFCQRAPQCKLVVFPTAFHRLLIEKDEIRNVVLEKIRQYFK